MTAYLILENGTTFTGEFFGKKENVTGEFVFTTGMNGYLETITDPANKGQIIVQTFPLVGNYGVISSDLESDVTHVKAYITKYLCQEPSNFRSEEALDTFFVQKGIVGVKGIDTRQLTKLLRDNGVMNGKITTTPPTDADLHETRVHSVENPVAQVSTNEKYVLGEGDIRIALLDFGVKKSVIEALTARGCEVHVLPHNWAAEDILAINPHGVLLSAGPGDPKDPANAPLVETIRTLDNKGIPMFGICLGHLLLAIAKGYKTEKMTFGHRGANQPVKDTTTGRVYITAQNHGYTVITRYAAFVNVNDGSCEGLDYGNSFSVQFRPGEGPQDTDFLYDEFIERIGHGLHG